jgi:hypothetical protein
MTHYKLNSKSLIKEELISLAKNSHPGEWMLLRGFNVMPVPMHILENDPLVVALSKRFTFKPGIFKMDPKNYYAFHVDASRHVAVNMMLEGPDSYTMFGEKTASAEVTKIEQLMYEDSSYYIFNTSKPHAVLNLSDNTRYLLTVGIIDLEVDYETVKEFCIQHNL